MRFEIVDGKIDVKGGTIQNGKRAGEQWEIRSQEAWMYNGDLHPVKVKLTLPRNHAGYGPGFYTLAPESFGVGDYYAPKLRDVHVLVREEPAKLAKVG